MLLSGFILMLQVASAEAASASDQVKAKWVDLFDGKTLNGWHNPYEWGEARVVDGEIHLKTPKKMFLVTDKEFSDFVLELEVRIPPKGKLNSGILFRCHEEKNMAWGYQAEIDDRTSQRRPG